MGFVIFALASKVCSHFHRCLDSREESYSYPNRCWPQSRPYETYNVVNTHTQQTNKSTRLPKLWTESLALLIFTLFVVDFSPYPSHIFCSLVLSPQVLGVKVIWETDLKSCVHQWLSGIFLPKDVFVWRVAHREWEKGREEGRWKGQLPKRTNSDF